MKTPSIPSSSCSRSSWYLFSIFSFYMQRIIRVFCKRNKEMPMGYSSQREINNYWQTPENSKDKTKTTQTQHLKLKTNKQHGPHQKTGGRLRCSGRVNSPCFLQDTRHVAHVKSSMRKGHQVNKSSFILETSTVLSYLSTKSWWRP